MTHNGIWAAVDKIAARQGLSCSGLARACGMVVWTQPRLIKVKEYQNMASRIGHLEIH